MKKVIVAAVIVAAALIAGGIAITNGLSDGANILLEGIDLSGVPDGNYVGTHEHGRWTNTLSVRVESGRIVSIDVIEDVFGAGILNSSDEVFRRVIEAQNTQIDAVSGATVTSKAYLKAIENAFND